MEIWHSLFRLVAYTYIFHIHFKHYIHFIILTCYTFDTELNSHTKNTIALYVMIPYLKVVF